MKEHRCIVPSGPCPAEIMIVGEAPGENEEREGRPFVGASGWELDQMLSQAGIASAKCMKTNVMHVRPRVAAELRGLDAHDENNFLHFCGPKDSAIPDLPPVKPGKYIQKEWSDEIERLRREVEECKPNLIIGVGGISCIPLLRLSGITKLRGTTHRSVFGPKFLPTFHPAVLFRDYTKRPVIILDLMKAERESHYPEIRIPRRLITIDPHLWEVEHFYETQLKNAEIIAADIETAGKWIKMISFAPAIDQAIVIPFLDSRQDDGLYWRSATEEIAALKIVRAVLTSEVPKVFQYGTFDFQRIWKTWHIPVRNWEHDTVLEAHALYPEQPKDLGFLGSIYTDEPAWKLMRPRASDNFKKDE